MSDLLNGCIEETCKEVRVFAASGRTAESGWFEYWAAKLLGKRETVELNVTKWTLAKWKGREYVVDFGQREEG